MVTMQEAFSKQIHTVEPITQEKVDTMIKNCNEKKWSQEVISTLMEGVVPGKTKMLYYACYVPSDEDETKKQLLINSCWDHRLDVMNELFVVESLHCDLDKTNNVPLLAIKMEV